MPTTGDWPLLWAVWLKAETRVRKLEEKVKKDMWLFTTLLASGLPDKMGEQDNKLESSECHFAKLGGC